MACVRAKRQHGAPDSVASPPPPQANICVQGALLWLGPALAAGWCLLLAAVAFFVSRSPDEAGLAAGAKLLPLGVLGSLLVSWVGAQMGAVQMELADSLQVASGGFLATTGALTVAALGWDGTTRHPALLSALQSKNGGASPSPIGRAGCVLRTAESCAS